LTHRATAERLCVPVKFVNDFVNDMVKLKRQTGDLLPRKQGTPKPGKLAPVTNWIVQRVSEKSDITLDELVAELEAAHGLSVSGAYAPWYRLSS
jgi:transposase